MGISLGDGGKVYGGDGGTCDPTIASITNVCNSKWNSITYTRQRSTGILRMYINGILETTGSSSNRNTFNTTSTYYIGSQQDYNTSLYYTGRMSIVQAYNVVLTAAQVIGVYNNQSPRYPNV